MDSVNKDGWVNGVEKGSEEGESRGKIKGNILTKTAVVCLQ